MAQWIRAFTLAGLLGISFSATQALASTSDAVTSYIQEFDGSWYLSIDAGRSLYKMDSDNYINPGPNWPNDHYYKNDIHDSSFAGLGAGYALIRYTPWFPGFMLGLDYTFGFSGKVSGHINQYNLDQFRNYTYSYDFSRQTLLALLKVTVLRYQGFMPYLTVGTGPSFNKGSNYSEEPASGVTPRVSPGYSTGTNTSWSYMAGIGFDYVLRDDVALSLEYNYGNFGKVRTGSGAATSSVTGINYSEQHLSNTLRANSFLLRLTYLLNCN